jgi:hypothetical protein
MAGGIEVIPNLPAMPATLTIGGRAVQVTPRFGCLIFRALDDTDTHDRTEGGLWIPPQALADQQQLQAEVVGRGEGVEDALLLPGARVLTRRFGKSLWLDDDERHFEAPEGFVLAVVAECDEDEL